MPQVKFLTDLIQFLQKQQLWHTNNEVTHHTKVFSITHATNYYSTDVSTD